MAKTIVDWISVGENVPATSRWTDHLVFQPPDRVQVACYDIAGDRWTNEYGDEVMGVTHWCAIPDLPVNAQYTKS